MNTQSITIDFPSDILLALNSNLTINDVMDDIKKLQ